MLPCLLIYLVLIIVRPHEYLPVVADLDLPRYVLLLTFILWLFKSRKSLLAPQQLLLPLLCSLAVLSRVLRGWLGGAVYAIAELVPLLMLFFVISSVGEAPRQRMQMLRVICLSTLVLLAHGFDQVLTDGVGWTGAALETSTGTGRIQYIGVFADPNDLAMLFVACVPLCIYLGSQSGKWWKLPWWAAGAALAVGVYLTNSRGGLLALLIMVGLWSMRFLGKLTTGVLAALVVPVLVAATRLSDMGTDEESAAGRVDAWYTALQLFREQPLTGVGFGLFTEHNSLTAHNSWLLVLAELGIVGYVVWNSIVGLSMQQLWTLAHPHPRPPAGSAPDAVEPAADRALAADHALAADRALAAALWYSGVGILVCAVFLSRSFTVLMFLFWGWASGVYNGALLHGLEAPQIARSALAMRWAAISIATIPAYYIVVRILLANQ